MTNGIWWKAFRLRPADRRALIEALALTVVVRIGLWTLPFTSLRRLSNRWADHGKGDGNLFRLRRSKKVPVPFSTERIAWAITAVGSRLWGTTCLVEALAADVMLRRHGHASTLKLGVRRGAATVDAHAWVECGGSVVVGAGSPLEEYSVLS